MGSLYWDDFKRRASETVTSIQNNSNPPIRRVAIFITNKCNFRCKYCNMNFGNSFLSEDKLDRIINKYKKTALFHITGGEPSLVPYLYDYMDSKKGIRFNLNSNLLKPPPKNIQRLKVSLDTNDEDYFNQLVRVKGAFKSVVNNIKKSSTKTTTTITYVLSKATYKNAPLFYEWTRKEFPNIYAVFFSCYKGDNPTFAFNKKDIDIFFSTIIPNLENVLVGESLQLFKETIDEKFRIIQGIRFPENSFGKCYLSMSERVYDWIGKKYNCSHLYRDSINHKDNSKRPQCLYGCNRRLVKFNTEISAKLQDKEK